MHDRLVSMFSLAAVVISLTLFGLAVWWLLIGEIAGFDGIFALCGWLMAGGIFAYRVTDPAWLDPVSIVKVRAR